MTDGPVIMLRVWREPGGGWVMDDHNMSLLNYLGVSAALVIFAGPKVAPKGYLAKVGPAPLRYRNPAPPPECIVPLPPLSMTNEVEKTEPIAIATNEPPVTNIVAAAPAAPSTNTTVMVPVEPDMFTPRMFVQFFNQPGTNTPVSVIAPVPFSPPPATIPAAPSSATYNLK